MLEGRKSSYRRCNPRATQPLTDPQGMEEVYCRTNSLTSLMLLGLLPSSSLQRMPSIGQTHPVTEGKRAGGVVL